MRRKLGRFLAMRLDPSHSEQARNLQKQLGIHAYPTLVFLTASGEELGRVVGFRPPEEFLGLLKDVETRRRSW